MKKIGLLFSLSGTVSVVGKGQLQAALMAIEEMNQDTALTFNPIIRDDRSEPQEAAKQAYSLFTEEKVDVVVGCYMSSVRNSVMSTLNETGGLLLYPTLYEGQQVHPNVFYLGAVPNQQVEPLLCWTFHNISRNFVLVGSDYVYPRSTNRQVKRWVENGGGKVLLESYFPLGCTSFDKFFITLKKLTKPNLSAVVFSTLVGTSVPAFYTEFRRNKFSFPIISPLTSEREISLMCKEASSGHILASPYFRTLDTDANRKFVKAFEQRFGDQPISREMMTTYGAIRLLSMAYERAVALPYGTVEAEKVRMVIKDLCFHGPQGDVIMDPTTQHLWQWCHIGRVNQEGAVDIIWSSPGPIPPRHDAPYLGITILGEDEESGRHESKAPIGENPRFVECVRIAKIASKTSCSVLITGETGTGKEQLARFIHLNSTRGRKPFVAINCPSIPRDLMETELFGYEEGAFTGARKTGKPGKFELGNGGTVFLDEIGEMPLDLQAHLLRVIEDKQIYRIGGTTAIRLDVRFIAATNKNLSRETVEGGSFRRDVFYRLSIFHIHLPRLCERPEDIARLAHHFLRNCKYQSGEEKFFAPEAIKLLEGYEWPGNVRELANVVERSFYLSQGSKQITLAHLPGQMSSHNMGDWTMDRQKGVWSEPVQEIGELPEGSRRSNGLGHHTHLNPLSLSSERLTKLRDVEKELIAQALSKSRFNFSKAARLLGIGRSTLYRKLKKYTAAQTESFD
ncbi:MAG: transporter substrate-binding protein [Deltaproteobacteria bacterium]|nr:transporter substrate-binding protein [Deltaproteobacteria bacterium]